MSVVIIDYGSGNLRSAQKAFQRAAQEAETDVTISVSADPASVAKADRVVLPGVGAFADCMDGLAATPGMLDAFHEAVVDRAVPMLGVCVGMQLLATRGLEHKVSAGLNLIGGDVRPMKPNAPHLKIPHMGWNVMEVVRTHPLLDGIPTGSDGWHAYFVHSYVIAPEVTQSIIALADHGGPFAAIVGRDNIVGTQFHPEKSQKLGLKLIENFLSWSP
ncbi:MAG: imidazole glycerol phosphate synthase subunit HisH [Pseudomonadota bacterium]